MRWLCVLVTCGTGWAQPDAIRFFETRIRPVLHSSCVGCHNDAKPTNGLSLESREGLLNGGNGGLVVSPGQPESSRLVRAIEQSGDLKMPPGGKLKPEQIADLKRWIEMGLPWPEGRVAEVRKPASSHWAFQAPRRHIEPAVKNAAWPKNAIDRFILARLEKEGLAPSPQAGKETLIRRLHLDLLGLPPAPAEVDRFLA
ncbi:MAG: DUF1549 domain-containing protein, partial [Bryobacteraceae bacterium]